MPIRVLAHALSCRLNCRHQRVVRREREREREKSLTKYTYNNNNNNNSTPAYLYFRSSAASQEKPLVNQAPYNAQRIME